MTSVAPKHSAPDSSIPRVERSWTVNDVLREYPSVAPVFKTFGIHTCCGGTRTLDEAARHVRVHDARVGTPLLAAGGILSALGAYAFAYVVWRTIDGTRAVRAVEARVASAASAGALSTL